MTDRPILFSGPMVRAILAGRKTQTRRVVSPADLVRPVYEVGDRLWVREAWHADLNMLGVPPREIQTDAPIWYTAGGDINVGDFSLRDQRGRPGIHMPRWASRLTLAVTDVRAQRLQDISEADAAAEGWEKAAWVSDDPAVHRDAARDWFMDLWDSINAKRDGGRYAWAANPWVVAITFDVHRCNIDAMKEAAHA